MNFENDFLDTNTQYQKQNKNKGFKIFFNILLVVLGLICIFIVAFYAVFYQVKVIGVSMQPTYNELLSKDEDPETSIYQDVVVVNRHYKGDNGNVIIIKRSTKTLIKRQIAKGKQTLVLRQVLGENLYEFYLDGQKLNESYIGDNYLKMDGSYFNKFKQLENVVVSVNLDGTLQGSLLIPEGYVFALGDNRGDSSDSLIYGPFSTESVAGTVVFSYKYNENLLIGIGNLLFGKH